MGVKKGKGAASSTIEYAPWKLERMLKVKQRTEARWAAMAGPVTVTLRDPRVVADSVEDETRQHKEEDDQGYLVAVPQVPRAARDAEP